MAVENSAAHWVEPALPKRFLRLLSCRILNKRDARALAKVVEMIPPSSSLKRILHLWIPKACWQTYPQEETEVAFPT